MSRVEMLIRSPPLSKHETSFLKEANVFFAGFNIGIEWRPPFPARRRRVNECLSFLDRWRSFFRCHTKPSTYGRDANAAFAMNCRQLSDLTLAEASFYGDWLDNYSKKKTIQSNRLVTAVGIFWDLLTRKLFHNRTNLYLLLGSKNTLEFQNSLLIPWFKRFFGRYRVIGVRQGRPFLPTFSFPFTTLFAFETIEAAQTKTNDERPKRTPLVSSQRTHLKLTLKSSEYFHQLSWTMDGID